MPNAQREIPSHVAAAKLRGDTEALSIMGSVGGKRAAHSKRLKKAQDEEDRQLELFVKEIRNERILAECRARDEEANLHTHPID